MHNQPMLHGDQQIDDLSAWYALLLIGLIREAGLQIGERVKP